MTVENLICMRFSIAVLVLFMLLIGCKEDEHKNNLAEGVWRVELDVMDRQALPFNLKVDKSVEGNYTCLLYTSPSPRD